jgi:hypothetical protein
MKRLSVCILLSLIFISVFPQHVNSYEVGISAQKNLDNVANLAPSSDGGIGFDNRYQGVVGSPRLFDTLLTSYLLVTDRDFYIKLGTDIDLMGNRVLYTDPKSNKLFALPADNIRELIIVKNDKELVFRTTKDLKFEKDLKENKFYQVLTADPVQFIKIPAKTFVEADYKGTYSIDRRFDEYKDQTKYFIKSSDNVFHQVKLNKKSLIKRFPDKKDLINQVFEEKTSGNNEELVISLLEKF